MTVTAKINEIAAQAGLSTEQQARVEAEARRLSEEER